MVYGSRVLLPQCLGLSFFVHNLWGHRHLSRRVFEESNGLQRPLRIRIPPLLLNVRGDRLGDPVVAPASGPYSPLPRLNCGINSKVSESLYGRI
uniref:Uncharacterized protein n=1 Tax=Arundo donax TaxID=35708 RepID=A0A0A9D2Z9_ARUDO